MSLTKKIKFTESQIIKALKENEQGRKVRIYAGSWAFTEEPSTTAAADRWRSKYAGMETSQLKKLKELEEENRKLKQRCPAGMYADISLDNVVLKDLLSKKF